MESKALAYSQLFLRVAVSITFLSAVADRLGIWGAPGEAGVAWGNWENFVIYSNSVNSFVPAGMGNILAVIATSLEIILPLLLLIGYNVRLTALASGTLLLLFAIGMTISFGIKPSLDYSVWTGSAGCFLLSGMPNYKYSIDDLISKKK